MTSDIGAVKQARKRLTLNRRIEKCPRPIVLAQSGIGKVNAATLRRRFCSRPSPATGLIFSGVAGALADPEVGSVVLVTRGATHDYGLVSDGVFTCVPVGDLPLPGIAQPLRDLTRSPSPG